MSADPTPAVTGEVARKIDSVLDGYVHVYQTNQDHKFQGSSVYWDIHNNIRKSLKDSLAASEAEAVKVEALTDEVIRQQLVQRVGGGGLLKPGSHTYDLWFAAVRFAEHAHGIRHDPAVRATPSPQAAERVPVEAESEDTKRLDWLQRDMLFSEPTGIEWSDGAFTFPYLVSNAGGSGGGVGHARFKTLREAIDAAIAASPSSMKEQP